MKADELLDALERLLIAASELHDPQPVYPVQREFALASAIDGVPPDAIAQLRAHIDELRHWNAINQPELERVIDGLLRGEATVSDCLTALKLASDALLKVRRQRDELASELRRAWRPWPPEGPERRVNAISIIEDEERYELFCPMSTDTWDGEGYEVFWCEIEESKP